MFAGSSTGVHFISQAEQQMQMLQINTSTLPSAAYNLYLHNIWGQSSNEFDAGLITNILAQLPPDAVEMIELAIDLWTPLYPIVHKPTTLDAINEMFDDPTNANLGILYQALLLLSLGSFGAPGVCTQPHQHSICLSETYYSLASVISSKVLELPCLQTLQGLELAQIYLQLSCRYAVASQFGGIATRLAQNLGLHRHSQRFKFDPLQTELRRRTWWCQYTLDALVFQYLVVS